MIKTWIKRLVFASLLLVGGTFLVWGGNGNAMTAPPGFVVVHYWEKWTGNEGAQMRQIVDDFNNSVGKEKHIFVQYMSMSAVDQKTLAATSAGVPPDIAGLWDQQVAQFAALGAVQPLDDFAAAHGINEQTYVPVYWQGCHYNKHLYALVSSAAAVALLYNKQLLLDDAAQLRAAGLDPTRAPRTLAEMDRYAAALTTRYPTGLIDRAGYVPLQSWYVPFTVYWFGGDIFDPQTQKFTLTSPQFIRSYEWVRSYSRRFGANALADFSNTHILASFDSPQNPFLTGKLAMQQQGPWMANYIEHLKPSLSRVLVSHDHEWTLRDRTDNYAWAFAPFPSAVPGLENVSFCTFDTLMIPVGARHPAEAFEFMAYVNRQDVTEKLNTLHSDMSPLRKVSARFLANHPNPFIAVFQNLAASPNAHGVPAVPIWPEVFRELTDASQAVALEDAPPEKILRDVQDRLQAEYDRFCAIQNKRNQDQLTQAAQ
jgi:multiple sugar transport system substrate-binding protein